MNAAKAENNFTRAAEFFAKIEEIERAIAELQQQERLTVYVDPFSVPASTAVIEKNPSNGLDDFGVASAIPGFDQRVKDFEQRVIKAYGDNNDDYNKNYINKLKQKRILY